MFNNIAIIQNSIYSEFDIYFNIPTILEETMHKQPCFECTDFKNLIFLLCPSVLNALTGEAKILSYYTGLLSHS